MHPLIKDHEAARVIVIDTPPSVIEDVIKNGGDSRHIRATTLRHDRPHVLQSPTSAVRIEYSVSGGAWFVVSHFGIDLCRDVIESVPVETPPPPLADPLDVLYPPSREGADAP